MNGESDKFRRLEWYKRDYGEEFEEFKKGKYPLCNFFDVNYTVTWCPFCEVVRTVYAVTFDWWHCEECDCVFCKVLR